MSLFSVGLIIKSDGSRISVVSLAQCVVLASEAESAPWDSCVLDAQEGSHHSSLSSCFLSSLRCRHVEEVLQNQRMLLESVTSQVAHKKSSLQTSAKQIEDR